MLPLGNSKLNIMAIFSRSPTALGAANRLLLLNGASRFKHSGYSLWRGLTLQRGVTGMDAKAHPRGAESGLKSFCLCHIALMYGLGKRFFSRPLYSRAWIQVVRFHFSIGHLWTVCGPKCG